MMLNLFLHPMIVHFPIAFIYLGIIYEFVFLLNKHKKSFFDISYYLLLFSTFGAMLSYMSGMFFTEHPVGGEIFNIFERHQQFALISTLLLIFTSLFKTYLKMKEKYNQQVLLGFFLYFLCVLVITYTAHLGGTLVYDFMVK